MKPPNATGHEPAPQQLFQPQLRLLLTLLFTIFFFNHPATTEIYTLSLHDALPICDPELHKDVEPGTPSPQARLGLISAIRDAGLGCHVMVAPVLPRLTDSAEHLDALLAQIAAAGATGVTVFGLHLRGSTRGWFMGWLARSHPELVGRYRELYRRGAYLPPRYREELYQRAAPLIAKHGLAGDHRRMPRTTAAPE